MIVDDILANNDAIDNKIKELLYTSQSLNYNENNTTNNVSLNNNHYRKVNELSVTVDVDTIADNTISFADIGYKEGDIIILDDVNDLNSDLEFSKKLMDAFNSPLYLSKITTLVYAPLVDLTKYTNIGGSSLNSGGFLFGCTNLKTIPKYDFSTVTNTDGAFDKCYNLDTRCFIGVEFPVCKRCAYTFGDIEDEVFYCPTFHQQVYSRGMFQNIKAKKLVLQGELWVQTFGWLFNGCKNLVEIEGIIKFTNDVSGENNYDSFTNCNNLERIWVKGWEKNDLYFHQPTKLEWNCIKFLIDNAENGTARYLYISASQRTRYESEPDYQVYITKASEKNITLQNK